MAGGFGLDRADRFSVNEQRVVRLTGPEGQLAHGNAAGRGEVHGAFVLHFPAAWLQQRVDFLSS